MSNKVKFGLKNVHYSPITVDAETGAYTYATPVAIPGAVSILADPKGEKFEFYADDVIYFSAESNQGYEGPLEVALIPESFRKDILQEIEDVTTGGMFEDASKLPKPFALMFEFNGDANKTRHVFYHVETGRPSVRGNSKNERIEPTTETLNIMSKPGENSIVKGKFKVGDAGYDSLFTTVPTYTPPAE